MNPFPITGALAKRLGAGVLALALASCGGSVAESFRASRIVSFGDEASVVFTDATLGGVKYTVNYASTSTPGTYDCQTYPVWSQSVAAAFGLVFPQCNPSAVATTSGLMRAAAGADVTATVAQMDAFIAADRPSGGDIATVMAGLNDILAQYDAIKAGTTTEAAALVEIARLGGLLGASVNRVARSGPRVLVSTVYDLNYTPFGRAQTADDRALFSRLTVRFNNALKDALINDGHMIGLVFADNEVANMTSNPAVYGITNVVDPACAAAVASTGKRDDVALLPNCNSNTVTTGIDPAKYLWAGNLLLAPGGQARIGGVAGSRATSNPF